MDSYGRPGAPKVTSNFSELPRIVERYVHHPQAQRACGVAEVILQDTAGWHMGLSENVGYIPNEIAI